jgi:hypothetical protein
MHEMTMHETMVPPSLPAKSSGEPSFWRELADGTVGPVVRVMVNLGLGIVLAGLVALSAYFLAAMVPQWGHNSNYGVYPKDELVGGLAVVASGVFIAATAWLWSRKGRWRAIVSPTIYTICIVVTTTILCLFVESTIRGEKDFLFSGLIMLGAAGILLVWVMRLHRISRGRPTHNQSDGMPNVRCPNCNYRMVGLHESRCPECGTQYTLDELLGKQNFSKTG